MFFAIRSALAFFLIFNISFAFSSVAIAVDYNDPSVTFLLSIKDMSADYTQEQYENGKKLITEGTIVIQKPDSVMLTHKSKQMNLKIISIDGNVKMIDEDLGQTTYIDNKYNELMQFFTKNLKPEMLSKDKYGNLCMSFNHLDNNFEACLKLDLEKQNLNDIVVFLKDNDDKTATGNNIAMYQIMTIKFKNVKINKGVDKKIFFVKDNRIFNDEDEL